MRIYSIYRRRMSKHISVGEGGSAYLIIHRGEVVKTASKGFLYTTNNRMEMLAKIQ